MEKIDIQCLGFIMDGNRRWAKERNLQTLEGHKKGVDVLVDAIRYVRDVGISHAIFYGFSSENWNRSAEEVAGLISLFSEKLQEIGKRINDKNETEKRVRYRFVGDLDKFPPVIREGINQLEKDSAQYTETTIWIALSYGGRNEILQAVNKAVEAGEEVTEESFEKLLWTAGMPDPDLIIRTGGQKRLSNYLPWQSVYSELLFLKEYWPDFTNDRLELAVKDYSERRRNFGK